MSELPPGWSVASFGQIAEIKLGKMLDRTKNRGEPTPYLRNINVRWNDFDLNDISEMRMSEEERASLSIGNDDIMVCEGGEPGRSAVWDGGPTNLTFQKALMRVRPLEGVEPRLLVAFLRKAHDSGELEGHFTGTTIKHLPQAALSAVSLPIPPVPEQRRIVAKVDNLSGKSKRARDQLDHIPRLVEKYKQAILAAAFSGHMQSSRSGRPETVPISSTIAALDQGWSPKCESEPASNPDDWAVIKTTAIQPIHFNGAENKKLPASLTPRPQIVIEPDDVLITRAGPRSRVAIACIVREARPRLMLCDKAYRLRVNSSVADPTFVALMLNAPQALEILEQMKTGINDSGLNLTQAKFLDLPIPSLALAQQKETVHRIEMAFAWIEKLAKETGSARKLIDHLDQAVLAKAFRGELVPQDPNDESASVLLERIKAQRATASGANMRRGRRTRAGSPA